MSPNTVDRIVRAPGFWARTDSILPSILAPLSGIYDVCAQARSALTSPQSASVPVICVGNAVVGGAGKTPCTIALLSRLRDAGVDAHAISRGYRGRIAGPHRVDSATDTAADVGDEPLLLAQAGPTWVSRDKIAAARSAAAAGAQVVVLDDGLQNPTLKKDLSWLVMDASSGIGNGRLLPAGPLREPLERALGRVDAAIVLDGAGTGRDGGWPDTIDRLRGNLPVFRARLVPVAAALRSLEHPVVAFSGLGHPEKFFSLLYEMGCDLVGTYPFPDHHRYSPNDVMQIVETAAAKGARAVTTAKDAVRLPQEAQDMVDVIDVVVEFQDEAGIDALLQPIV
jgi:tetraacyldisaccharide 4'-kinase